MRVLIAGYGIQGQKRPKFIDKNSQIISIVDPFNKNVKFKSINEVSLNSYDSVFICTSDNSKEELINYCVIHKKHILVEKPLLLNNKKKLLLLEKKINKKKIVLYTAYNHRFEPHIKNLKKILNSKKMGKIYLCRLFYGNGTAKLVKKSKWRDKKSGVFGDLGPHLMDICCFLFGNQSVKNLKLISANCLENKSPDHVIVHNNNHKIKIQLEMSLCMWKNDFTCDIICEKGSLHVSSLCKWGPSTLSIRKRKLPSGLPQEIKKTIVSKDPTWSEEFKHFKHLIKSKKKYNSETDLLILENLKKIENEITKRKI